MSKSKFPDAIIAEMGAGLGNQINIYAAAKRLSIEKGVPLYLDVLWFDSWPKYMVPRSFGLDKFKISARVASKKQVSKYLFKTRFRYFNTILGKFRLFEKKVYKEFEDFSNREEFLALPEDAYVRGYYNRTYYDDIKTSLMEEFQLKEEYGIKIRSLLKEVGNCESVSIHIRRGDLLKIPNAYVLPIEYYKKAVEIMREKLKNPKFYIFGDDIKWCKENFSWIKEKFFVEENTVEQDFELMKRCKNNIIANSSLSWWVAYLNDNPEKIVIAPKIFSQYPKNNPNKNWEGDENIPDGWIEV